MASWQGHQCQLVTSPTPPKLTKEKDTQGWKPEEQGETESTKVRNLLPNRPSKKILWTPLKSHADVSEVQFNTLKVQTVRLGGALELVQVWG